MKLSLIIKRIPILNRLFYWYLDRQHKQQRRALAMTYYQSRLESLARWVTESKETTNFTYELHSSNYAYLASFVAIVTGVSKEIISRYIDEVLNDEQLRTHVRNVTERAPAAIRSEADAEARFARRVGWYAVVRATKPKVIIETGVDKGLGACVLCAALMANEREGFSGRYFGTDINPQAGWLLTGVYQKFGTMLYGDSLQSLKEFAETVDLFINDSDHSTEYERKEYELMEQKLTDRAVILGDNAHCNSELHDFSVRTHRQFLYWQEWPVNHWYPGCGIGFSFKLPKL